MAYDARVLQILIASPGDVGDERQIMANVIFEWNYVNSRDRSIVLLPLRWETNAFPELGIGPQDAINQQVVDYCDMAVGVFWTRLGTPTEVAASGTAEEITRVADAGKPVMLYFSREKVDLETIDLQEYDRLKNFKETLRSKALIEDYQTHIDFREKFSRQLAMRISDIIAKDSSQQTDASIDSEKIIFAIAAGNKVPPISVAKELRLMNVRVNDIDDIPDYGNGAVSGSLIYGSTGTVHGFDNANYYRELVDYYCELVARGLLWVTLYNSSDLSLNDVHLEINVRASDRAISVDPVELAPPTASQLLQTGFYAYPAPMPTSIPKMAIEPTGSNEWRIESDIAIVQSQRTVASPQSFTLKATDTGTVSFDATVYSSNSRPFFLNTELNVTVEQRDMSYQQILKQLISGYGENTIESAAEPGG